LRQNRLPYYIEDTYRALHAKLTFWPKTQVWLS
jgi:hypothetical protein